VGGFLRECLVERGGALLMRPLLIHASSKVSAPPDGLDWRDAV